MRRGLAVVLATTLALSTAAATLGDLPMSVFVVHCEPTNADEAMWRELVSLVSLADQYSVPLSIDFTPQWAEMLLEDAEKLAALDAWLAAGHEIGCHHHAYWSTMSRAASWDGYTSTPLEEILPQDRPRYRGTMEEFMMLLAALPGERRSGCLGSSEERDEGDWPCEIVYSTVGNAVEDAVSQPAARSIGGCEVLEVGHALIAGAERGALRELYGKTDSEMIFGVVGHVYNYRDFPAVFEQWFAYLASLDDEGARRGTVSDVLDGWGDEE